jgi:hypothetical protein
MKKIKLFLSVCFAVLSFGTIAQIQVNSSGNVGIGTTPSSSYNLKVGGSSYFSGSSYFNANSSFYYPVVISGSPANSPYLIVSASTGAAPNALICGTTTGTYILSINGNALASGYWQDSDSKLKKNITPLDGKLMLSKIMNIDGKKYEFKNKDELKGVYSTLNGDTLSKMIPQFPKGEQYGFIAQELEKDFPELVETDSITKLKAINYTGMIPVLLQAIKEQQTRLTQLQQQLDQIESTSGLKSAAITTGTNNPNETQAQLDQNNPNPFNRETKIGCFIPESSGASVLYIYNMNGTQLQQYPVNGKGKQTVTIRGNSLEPGMYLYTLVVDGKEVDTKRMILTK